MKIYLKKNPMMNCRVAQCSIQPNLEQLPSVTIPIPIGIVTFWIGWLVLVSATSLAESLDRRALVERHAIHATEYAPNSPASVGNGEFAFTFDITGMQTFPREEPGDVPLGTMAQWGWHAFPESKAYSYADTLQEYPVHGRQVSYATDMETKSAKALRANPHRFNLAQIGLFLTSSTGKRAAIEDVKVPTQKLSLWNGEVVSTFEFEGKEISVRTVAHPDLDLVAFQIESNLIANQQLGVEIRFAYPVGVWGPQVDEWNRPAKHSTEVMHRPYGARVERKLDETEYVVNISTDGIVETTTDSHTLIVKGRGANTLQLFAYFTADPVEKKEEIDVIDYSSTQRASANHWHKFWSTGGAIDLSNSRDPRWRELERRIVTSQYVTAINCAGTMPPQETGLVCNSWFGKSHLEMHWWHATHFAHWGRIDLLERSLPWYKLIMPAARNIARRQGYKGARWPKMVGPAGISSPSNVGELLIWQQPHPIYFAELVYRDTPNEQTLRHYQEIVEATAEFMADYAHYESTSDRYVLGPVLIPAQECYDGRSLQGVMNPTYELAYWRWGLRAANLWRERLGLIRNEKWDKVADKIAKPYTRNGVYTAIENAPFTRRRDHPSMLAALGVLPDVGLINQVTMKKTLADVTHGWDWQETWGWDYPMMAMTAARLGMPSEAIDYLLLDTPKNQYLLNGHCRQQDRLPIYLPANGGLLSAIAMMAAGWDSEQPLRSAPGFPNDGSWVVRQEGLRRMP